MVNVGEVPEADLLRDRLMGENGSEPDPRESHRNRRILGQILAHRGDAAGAFEIAAPQRHDLADAEAKAERRGAEQKPRMRVDDRGFDPAANGFRPHGHGHGDDEADARHEILQENRQRIRRQRDVGILGEDEIMPRLGERRDEIVELGTDRGAALRMDEAAGRGRVRGRKALRRVKRRQFEFGGADQDLVIGVILIKNGALRPFKAGIETFDRQNHRDGRLRGCARAAPLDIGLREAADQRKSQAARRRRTTRSRRHSSEKLPPYPVPPVRKKGCAARFLIAAARG